MKKHIKRLLTLMLSLALLPGNPLFSQAQETDENPYQLKFRADGSFKIIQVSDLQEALVCSHITREFLYELARREKPDLFILTGDNIDSPKCIGKNDEETRRNIKRSIDAFMNVFDKIYKDFGVPVTMVFGNHDAEEGITTREEQFAMYAAHPSFIGVATDADKGVMGDTGEYYGTHNLLVQSSKYNTPVYNLWMFDSGCHFVGKGEIGWTYAAVQPPQIEWFNETNEATGKLPSIAFQHIVVPEVFDFMTPATAEDSDTYKWDYIDESGERVTKYASKKLPAEFGGEMNEIPCPGAYNYGQYQALNDAGNVNALFFGHEHINTFEMRFKDQVDLVNTPATGFGSYGWYNLRGARVITLNEADLNEYETYPVFYDGFYGNSWLRRRRLIYFNNNRTKANRVDRIFYRPLLTIAGWFGC